MLNFQAEAAEATPLSLIFALLTLLIAVAGLVIGCIALMRTNRRPAPAAPMWTPPPAGPWTLTRLPGGALMLVNTSGAHAHAVTVPGAVFEVVEAGAGRTVAPEAGGGLTVRWRDAPSAQERWVTLPPA
ncbi:hypothetical protein Afil01_61030 [Actinorhabdospora filicis]|uniref:Uncharacterized protein n=1 Tax=Actinorhabdospora filicis TaxID=1785913 RepID=A0A9W6SV37_9ACTN|nr:hypothetical protein [Actinorhabdospora filicis]GLZ81296.1 hypothetical protein Afil01_61030 [Actinorhabdospora filicis]